MVQECLSLFPTLKILTGPFSSSKIKIFPLHNSAMATTTPQSQHHRRMWRRCLASAFRTALACTIVGVATLYGPKHINRHIAFPAFSYVTAILIVTDATLGDALRGCWLALCATVMGVCPAILSLWLIGPARLTATTTAAAVAISAFVVVLPENTQLIAKRIALGQIVLAYVVAFINGGQTEPVMHPLHVAASTALGVVACVLALLLPFPCLAYCEVRENCKLYTENASERLKLLMKAFSAQDKPLISQPKSLSRAGDKLLHCIKSKQGSMQWERIPVMFLKPYKENPAESLQFLHTILRGMEHALQNASPPASINTQLKHEFVEMEQQILNQVKNMALQTNSETDNSKFLQTLHTASMSLNDLPSLFFMFCLKLLQNNPSPCPRQSPNDLQKKKETSFLHKLCSYRPIVINRSRLMPALKCSLSLGFAVLLGLVYSKENGFWSGLPVAISLASAREATFRAANVKAQGTVLGSVYGVIGCFVFERYVKIRFISLLPWFIFSSFLRQSRMYGQAGGVSAVIGAVLILGRKNFGAPSDFAIARITETFIGLSCSIMVDILLQPTRAAVLAKLELSLSLQSLQEAVGAMSLSSSSSGFSLEEKVEKMRYHVEELGKFIEEAEAEPSFWFLPFHSAGYVKIKASLSKMVDFLHFGSHALRFVDQESENVMMWKEAAEADLKLLKDAVCSGLNLEEVETMIGDLEMGKSMIRWPGREVNELADAAAEEEEVVLSLSALAYCMKEVMKESREMEKGMKEVV